MNTKPEVLRHRRAELIRIVPVNGTMLWRIAWPDGPSDAVNRTRAREAAQAWAEAEFLRKNRRQRSLKSLKNFSWSSSPIEQNANASPFPCRGAVSRSLPEKPQDRSAVEELAT